MPACIVLRFRESDGSVPFDVWLGALAARGKAQQRIASQRLAAMVIRLAVDGHDLRRPTSAPLRDGIHELLLSVGRINYRVLYFFAGPGGAIISHGCTKEGSVEAAEIDRAIVRRRRYRAAPDLHTARSL